MRRIYESNALRRETGPFTPHGSPGRDKGPSPPDPDDTGILDSIVPSAIKRRGITIDVSTPQDVYEPDTPVPFRISLHNRLPFDISIRTPTPLLWTWEVNDVPNAAHISLENPPDESQKHAFSSGERKRFVKRWPQRFRVSKSEWERATPGTYTIRARVNLPELDHENLSSETTVEIRPDASSADSSASE